jgi:hypothetical protein
MAYPAVNAPYGFIPQNLIGAQQYAGGTRQLPIQYGEVATINFGDFVKLGPSGSAAGAGLLARASVLGATTANQISGVFMGCSFTSPSTKQKNFNQFWPGGTLAGDGMAYVADDPDLIFKAVALGAGGVVASLGYGSVGANIAGINNPVGTPLGNSLNGLNAGSESSATLPFRVVDLVKETSISVPMHGSSAALVVTLTDVGGLPRALPVGTDVAWLAPNGQLIRTGSQLVAAAALGATAVNLNTPPAAGGVATPIPAGSTIIFTIYPEGLVKINPGYHGYTSPTAV